MLKTHHIWSSVVPVGFCWSSLSLATKLSGEQADERASKLSSVRAGGRQVDGMKRIDMLKVSKLHCEVSSCAHFPHKIQWEKISVKSAKFQCTKAMLLLLMRFSPVRPSVCLSVCLPILSTWSANICCLLMKLFDSVFVWLPQDLKCERFRVCIYWIDQQLNSQHQQHLLTSSHFHPPSGSKRMKENKLLPPP